MPRRKNDPATAQGRLTGFEQRKAEGRIRAPVRAALCGRPVPRNPLFEQAGRIETGERVELTRRTYVSNEGNGQMRGVAQTTTVELDSSVAAAIHLARAKALDSTPVYGARDIVQSVESLIAAQTRKHGLTRSAVVRRLLEIRPDIAEFLI